MSERPERRGQYRRNSDRALAHQAGRVPQLRKLAWGAITAWVVLTVFAGVAFYLQAQNLHDDAIAQCQRVQARRTLGNYNDAVLRNHILSDVDSIMASLHQSHFSAKSIQERMLLAAAEQREARMIRYEPPTDCQRAVSEDGSYKPPKPVPFTDGLADRIIVTGP